MSEVAEETVDPGVEQVDEQPDETEEHEQYVDEDGVLVDGPEPEQEEAPPVPEGISIEELEKVRKKLDASATTWRNRVSQLLGEEAQMLVVCELCDPLLPGFHFPAELEQPRDALHARLLDVLRAPLAPEYQEDPYTRLCSTCNGYGMTKTRSLVPGKTERVCPTCQGKGFQALNEAPVAQPTNEQVEEIQYELPNDQPLVVDDKDAWGSPKILESGMENPNWGRMPQYKDPTLP
jgi:hypothetical protein